MNLVVTGATSFLGTALIRQLLTQGHQVYGVVRPDSPNLSAMTEAEPRFPARGGKRVSREGDVRTDFTSWRWSWAAWIRSPR